MNELTYIQIKQEHKKSIICNQILKALPDWFGIPEAIEEYTKEVAQMPFYACYKNDEIIGFAAIKEHNCFTSELYVLGVLEACHRHGIGRNLIQECENFCRKQGKRFLTVKTLADLNPDEGYAKTRAFYLACGFFPLEVFPQFWDERNPCLFMAKTIS